MDKYIPSDCSVKYSNDEYVFSAYDSISFVV